MELSPQNLNFTFSGPADDCAGPYRGGRRRQRRSKSDPSPAGGHSRGLELQ